MTKKYQELFDIIKASLWSGQPLNIHISDETRRELQEQTVEGLASAVLPEYLNFLDIYPSIGWSTCEKA